MKKYKLLKPIENDSIPIGSVISLGEVIGISEPEGDIPTQRLVNQGYLEEVKGDWISEIVLQMRGSNYVDEKRLRELIEKHCPVQQRKFTVRQIKDFVYYNGEIGDSIIGISPDKAIEIFLNFHGLLE